MSERCELCGAKLRSADEACRECGAPASSDAEASDVTAAVTAVESTVPEQDWSEPGDVASAHVDETDPGLSVDHLTPKRGPWLAVVGLVAVVGIGSAAYLMRGDGAEPEDTSTPASAAPEPPAPAANAPEDESDVSPRTDGCPDLEALAGHWSFSTEVTGSRVVQSSGLNGFYEVDVELDGCTATAALTKTGYTARRFTDARLQRASTTLAPGTGARNGMWVGSFDLESSVGPHGILEFAFTAEGESLSGIYRQRGARWRDAGLSGFLRGNRTGDVPRDPVAPNQPCAVRCNLACGSDARDVAPEAVDRCAQTCAADPSAAARCGDAIPVPDDFTLALHGPKRLVKHCKSIGGCAKRISKGQSDQSITDRLPDGWTEAKYVRGKKEGGVRLALRGAGGWWLSDPVFDVRRGTRLGTLRLYARQLGEGETRRYLLGLARAGTHDEAPEAFVACRLSDAPTCVRVPKNRGELVSALPEGNLAVAPRESGPHGMFSW